MMKKKKNPQTLSHYTVLEQKIKLETGWHKARIFVIIGMIVALVQKKTVNLTAIAGELNPEVKKENNYRRLQRFFLEFIPGSDGFARLLASFLPDGLWALSMDRTNWQFGEKDINILMLAVVYKGIAIPLLWCLLPKKGNSNVDERIALLERFIRLFGKRRIRMLLADREFVGVLWIDWLCNEKIPFVIRFRNDLRLRKSRRDKQGTPALQFLRNLPLKEACCLGNYFAYGRKLDISGMRIKGRDNHVIVMSYGVHPQDALDHYARRWEIETLFGCLKTRGFNLEDTHMSDPDKIDKLTGILALAFVWAHHVGEWLHEHKPIRIKAHGRKAMSLFRYGLDYLEEVYSHLKYSKSLKKLKAVLAFLVDPSGEGKWQKRYRPGCLRNGG
jgi:hypothetical protein